MTALNIRDLGADRKAALSHEAQSRGIPVAELVRQFIDEGLGRAAAERARESWVSEAREGLAFEAEHLVNNGPSLARYRTLTTGQ